MYEILITNPHLSLFQMDLQNTPFTVELGQGASIRFANAIINTGNAGATLRFGSFESSAIDVTTAAVPTRGMPTRGSVLLPDLNLLKYLHDKPIILCK